MEKEVLKFKFEMMIKKYVLMASLPRPGLDWSWGYAGQKFRKFQAG